MSDARSALIHGLGTLPTPEIRRGVTAKFCFENMTGSWHRHAAHTRACEFLTSDWKVRYTRFVPATVARAQHRRGLLSQKFHLGNDSTA
jgi:hypothetical protein